MRQASIIDIARRAGVSHSTVSRALRHSGLVNPETAERIRRIAEESGYRASRVARSLVTQRTDTIGVVVTNINDPFVACVVGGIEDAADACGYSVFLANSNAEPEREVRVVRSFEERRVDGIIVTSSRVGALYVEMLGRMRVPIVLLNNQHPSEVAHSVMIANVAGSRAVTAHLIALGHRRIAYIGDEFGYQSDAEREAGFREAHAAAGLEVDEALTARGDGKTKGGIAAMTALLRLQPPPTAVFCYNDMTALGAMHAIQRAGLSVPDDISVAGFDDLPISQYLNPALTTVHQPMREMGRMAMQTLARLMQKEGVAQSLSVQGELVVRASTAPPRK